MDIIFRKAGLEELDKLVMARLRFLGEVNQLTDEDRLVLQETNRKYFKESIQNGSYVCYIAVADDKIIGTSGITFYNVPPNKKCPSGKVAYISSVYICKEYRGRGIASKLFSLLVEEAKELGYEKLLLNATDMGRPLYEKFEFKNTHGDMEFIVGNKQEQL